MKESDNTFNVEKVEESSGFLLWQVTLLWQREIKKALRPYRLTHSQFVLLASAYRLTIHKQEVTQITLSAHTKIDPMTTSAVLKALQQKGFIHRQAHPTDTRAKTVGLTENGKKTIKKAVVTVEKFDADFFSSLGNKVKDLNQSLLSLLGAG